MVKINRQLPCY